LRKANFSPLEESILEREVEENFDVLKEKHTNSVNNVKKARIWSEITIKINALGVAFFTWSFERNESTSP
jgi:hypothetical protein